MVQSVQLLQIIERGPRRMDDVTAIIDPPVLRQVEVFARSRHELPKAGGLGAGQCDWIHRTFDEWQQGQFSWQATLFNLINDVIQVAATARHHPIQIIGSLQIKPFLICDQCRIQRRQCKAFANPVPQVAFGLSTVKRCCGLGGADRRHVAGFNTDDRRRNQRRTGRQ